MPRRPRAELALCGAPTKTGKPCKALVATGAGGFCRIHSGQYVPSKESRLRRSRAMRKLWKDEPGRFRRPMNYPKMVAVAAEVVRVLRDGGVATTPTELARLVPGAHPAWVGIAVRVLKVRKHLVGGRGLPYGLDPDHPFVPSPKAAKELPKAPPHSYDL
jgi:hypothetical protein